MAVCVVCGHDTPDPDARFCAACGRPLLTPTTTEVTSVLGLASPEDAVDDDAAGELDAGSTPGEAALIERLEPGTALLVVRSGPSSGARFLLDADLTTAGRHPDSDIFLDDITVSRRHAEFRRDGHGFRVVDVGSLNGTYVNRTRAEDVALAGSDEVQIGKYRLLFLASPRTGGDA